VIMWRMYKTYESRSATLTLRMFGVINTRQTSYPARMLHLHNEYYLVSWNAQLLFARFLFGAMHPWAAQLYAGVVALRSMRVCWPCLEIIFISVIGASSISRMGMHSIANLITGSTPNVSFANSNLHRFPILSSCIIRHEY
jgi:hypothetical protein